jgi:hypothetical protein
MAVMRMTEPRDVNRIYDQWGQRYGDPEELRYLDDYEYMIFGDASKYPTKLRTLVRGNAVNIDTFQSQ